MNILLFGISNIGKSSTGKVLANNLGFDFYDLDDEVKKAFGITLEEFVNTGILKERDYKRS
ncbi:shikimate kinase, partial [Butyrivibrio sp. INlla16]